MKIIKFSFLNIFAVMHQIEGSYSLNDEQPLPVCSFAQVFVFFNWAPSYLSFALRFFNLFGKTLSHTCFRFESVHTHFSFRRGSLSTHTLGLSGLHSVFFYQFHLMFVCGHQRNICAVSVSKVNMTEWVKNPFSCREAVCDVLNDL